MRKELIDAENRNAEHLEEQEKKTEEIITNLKKKEKDMNEELKNMK